MPHEFAGNYNTPLSSAQEELFSRWLTQQSALRGRDVAKDLENYDLRGVWSSGQYGESGHMPDTFKKPNHPSFSEESMYHNTPDPWGGMFAGGRWVGDDASGWSYQPSQRMLDTTHSREAMQQYFADNEPGVQLVMPTKNARPR